MKIKTDIILTDVAGEHIVVPIGKNAEKTRAIMRLNETGYIIWKGIESGKTVEEIATAISSEYDIDTAKSLDTVKVFISRLAEVGALEEYEGI